MNKRHHNAPGHADFEAQGHAVEGGDGAGRSKQALVREAARLRRRARAKKPAAKKAAKATAAKTAAAKTTAAKQAAKTAAAKTTAAKKAAKTAAAKAHDREFAKMNERRQPGRVDVAAESGQPLYLAQAARGLIRRVARVALAPLSLARAVVDRLRDRGRD
ncbi:MAG TPA: hypothetical protein VF945_11075 [Polyangia bacterium]